MNVFCLRPLPVWLSEPETDLIRSITISHNYLAFIKICVVKLPAASVVFHALLSW